MNQQTAQGLASLGRGPDSMLVHMAPQEVAGLQSLALKHGGSLTINPDTGLPEAGFLSKILPMVLGAGAMMIPGLQSVGAGWIGAGIGALQAVRTGSLKKGLMAGLGAYGGAGVAGSLMGAGTGALSSAAGAGVEIPASAIVPEAVAPVAEAAAPTIVAPVAAPASGMQQLVGVPGKEVSAMLPQPVIAPPPVAVAPPVTPTPVIPAAPAAAPQLDFANAYSQDQAMQNAVAKKLAASTPMDTLGAGFKAVTDSPTAAFNFAKANAYPLGALGIAALDKDPKAAPEDSPGMIRPFTYSREKVPSAFEDVAGAPLSSKERRYFTDKYTALTPYKAPGPEYRAAEGGPVEAMSDANAIGMNTGYPQADIDTGAYATPYQQPISRDMLQPQFAGGGSINLQGTFSSGGGQGGGQMSSSNNPQPFVGSNNAPSMMPQQGVTPLPGPAQEPRVRYLPTDMETIRQSMIKNPMSQGMAFAEGGISNLGDYSDGGRLLRGPGDGISDSIPATIGQKQQARLADGEFVVPARIVSELGNGSTEAGARQLYAMMDRVQKARSKTVGKDKVATNSRAAKLLPA